MLNLILIIFLAWVIAHFITGNSNNFGNGIQNKINQIRNAQNRLEETNKLIEETKNEIARQSRKENIEDLQFYVDLLEVLIDERDKIIGKSQAKSKANSFGKYVGKKFSDLKDGIKDGMKGD